MTLQITSCEFNRTEVMVISASPFLYPQQKVRFLAELNNRLFANITDLNLAFKHNLRWKETPNLAKYLPDSYSFLEILSGFEEHSCNEMISYDMYSGCQFRTTTGIPCQTWEELVPHLHQFSLATMGRQTMRDTRGYNQNNPYVQQVLVY